MNEGKVAIIWHEHDSGSLSGRLFLSDDEADAFLQSEDYGEYKAFKVTVNQDNPAHEPMLKLEDHT